jgi:hypothetical protein
MSALGDLNGDEYPDAINLGDGVGGTGAVRGIVNIGGLNFDFDPFQVSTIPAESGPRARVLSDVTGDGLGDALVLGYVNEGRRRDKARLSVLPGLGDGRFDDRQVLPLTQGEHDSVDFARYEKIEIASFDGNPHPDAALTIVGDDFSLLMVVLDVGTQHRNCVRQRFPCLGASAPLRSRRASLPATC